MKPKEKPKGILSRLYDWLGAAWSKTIKAITATVILALLLGGLWQQVQSYDDVMLEHFKVPADLEKAGYSPEVVATKLADNIKVISDSAVSHVGSNIGAGATTSAGGHKGGVTANKSLLRLQNFALASRQSPLDIEVPQTRVTVKSIFLYIFESLGMKPRRIDGEITSRGNLLALTVRITEGGVTRSLPVIADSTGSVEALLSEGARAIYRDIQPVILASYLYSSGPADTPAAKDLIQDCIYQDKDSALANVLWGIILLNESKYDDALHKFDAAEKKMKEQDSEIADMLVSCRARAFEGKAEFDAAEKIYKDALRRNCSTLTRTNYAGYLANRGDARDALKRYDQVLRVDPGSDIAHSGKGFALELLGRHEEAVKRHEEAIKLSPGSSSGYSNLASTLVNMKRYDEALAAASKAVRVEPRSANAYNTLGYVLQSRGKYEEALSEFERAVARHPSHTYAYINWADALLNLRKYDEAFAKAQRALEIDNNSAVAHSEMALILLNRKDFDCAVAECEKAVKKDKSYVPAYDNWVSALLYQKRYEEAEKKAREIVDIASESADAHNILGYVLKSRGKYEEAVNEFGQAAVHNRANTYVYINWAETLLDQKKLEDAAATARHAINLDNASADAHNMLGYALREQGHYDRALAEHEEAMRLNRHNIYAYTGWAESMLLKAEKSDETKRKEMYGAAEQKAKEAVAIDPYSVDALNQLGYVLQKQKRYKEALAEHKKAASLDPNDVYALVFLAQAYLALADQGVAPQENADKALAAAREAARIDTRSADAHEQLGFALLAKNDYENAIKAFEKATKINDSAHWPYIGWSEALRKKDECEEAKEKALKAFNLAPTLNDACQELNKAQRCLREPLTKCG